MTTYRYWVACTLSLLISTTAYSADMLTVNKADNLVAQWVAIEKQNSHLKNQWQNTQRLLKQRLSLLAQEKKQLLKLTNDNIKQVDDVDATRQKLLTLQTSMESQQARLNQWLSKEFSRVKTLHPQLPPPLANTWSETLAQLDDNDVSKRLESLLSLYQKYDEFNQRVSTAQATIVDSDGQQKMVQQLFLGAARGWYLSLDGTTAVAGSPQVSGWQWHHDNPVPTQPIKDALAMLAHQQEAALVTLPMSLSATANGKL